MIGEKEPFRLNADQPVFKQIRKALGLSRRQFGELLGVDQDTVGLWELGKVNPWLAIWQIKALDTLLQQLGISWHDVPNHLGFPNNPPNESRRTRRRHKTQ